MTETMCPVREVASRVDCERVATVVLQVTRPCGHNWQTWSCPGHAEALIGENTPTPCYLCGVEASAFVVLA